MTRRNFVSPVAAFTLVELLIGATLSAAVMAAVLSSYLFLGRNLGRLANQQTIETESRIALGYFAKDLQSATSFSGSLNATFFGVTTPISLGYSTVTYVYTSASRTLVRRTWIGGTVTSTRILLKNISDNNATTVSDLRFRFYDAAGNPYDSGPPLYTLNTNYPLGIRKISVSFALQTGSVPNGTRTPVYWVNSGAIAFRNLALLQ